jgi:hypothetical protein
MQGFYNITTKIKETLALDDFVNTITYGDIFEIDLNKQDIFPLSHFIVNSATLNGSVWQFSMSLLCMDIVDESKEDVTDKFLGNDNEQDVLNTQMAVINRLLELLRRGDLHTELYQLEGSPTIEPFVDRFDNKLAGWTLTFDVLIPNGMTIC